MGIRLGRTLAALACAGLLACAPASHEAQDAGAPDDVTPACEPVTVTAEQGADFMVSDGHYLYCMTAGTNSSCGALTRIEPPYGFIEQLVPQLYAPSGLAADATGVYWAENLIPAMSSEIVVRKLPFDGDAPINLGITSGEYPLGLAIDSTSVYFEPGNEIMQVPLAGGTPTVLVSGDEATWLLALAADESGVYWGADDSVVRVMMLPRGEATPVTLASTMAWPAAFALHPTGVYWTSPGIEWKCDGSVMKVDRSGGTPSLLASGECEPYSIAVDDSAVYWTTHTAPSGTDGRRGKIMKLPLGGGEPIVLALFPTGAGALTLDAANVYWSISDPDDAGTDRIMMCPK